MTKKDSIIKRIWNKITIEQWMKTLRLVIICMIFMVISEGIFEIPSVKDFFGSGLIKGKTGWIVYIIVWLVMFAQVAIIPIPALPILVACNNIDNLVGSNSSISGLLSWQTLGFILLITSATVLGSIVAYWIGRKFGKPAIRWVAGSEEDYNKWSQKLNTKTGKWLYAATVILPIFPDDLISLVVGSIKMSFPFYLVSNIVGKFIGLFTILIVMRIPGLDILFSNDKSSFPLALLVYSLILILAYIVRFVLNKIINRSQNKYIKLEEIKEKIIKYIEHQKSSYKELIIDYKLDKKLKTYLASNIKIHKFYVVDKEKKKQKIRILIECKASNYNEIIFDKKYNLTEPYETLIKDINNLNLV